MILFQVRTTSFAHSSSLPHVSLFVNNMVSWRAATPYIRTRGLLINVLVILSEWTLITWACGDRKSALRRVPT